MKHTKRTLSLLLAFLCLFSLTTGCATSQDGPSPSDFSIATPIHEPLSHIGEETLQYPGKNEEYEYKVYETYIEISEYLGDATNVAIPETLEDFPVKVVGGFSFSNTIKTVTLPEGIIVIKSWAFGNCDNLESINIPESVMEIGSYAFDGSNSLKSLTIPKGVNKIGDRAFGGDSESWDVLLVRFYKGTAAAKFVANHPYLKYEIIDK